MPMHRAIRLPSELPRISRTVYSRVGMPMDLMTDEEIGAAFATVRRLIATRLDYDDNVRGIDSRHRRTLIKGLIIELTRVHEAKPLWGTEA